MKRRLIALRDVHSLRRVFRRERYPTRLPTDTPRRAANVANATLRISTGEDREPERVGTAAQPGSRVLPGERSRWQGAMETRATRRDAAEARRGLEN